MTSATHGVYFEQESIKIQKLFSKTYCVYIPKVKLTYALTLLFSCINLILLENSL